MLLVTIGLIFLYYLSYSDSKALLSCPYLFEYRSDTGFNIKSNYVFESFDTFETNIAIPIPYNVLYCTEFVNYVEGYNGSHGLLPTGIAVLLNHPIDQNKANLRKWMSTQTNQWIFEYSNEPSIDILFEFMSYVDPGEDLLIDYGEDWFDNREINPITLPLNSIEESSISMITLNTCPMKYIEIKENKLIAKRNIPAGITLEITRALLIPITQSLITSYPLQETLWFGRNYTIHEDSMLDNEYCSPMKALPYDSLLDYTMFVTGFGSFYGVTSVKHKETHEITWKQSANVEYNWLFLEETQDHQVNNCSTSMILTIKSKTMIMMGEELIAELLYDENTGRKHILSDNLSLSCL